MSVSNRVFGLAFAAVFAVISTIGWLAFDEKVYWAWGASGTFLTLALIAPGVLLPLNRLWRPIADRLGHLNNWIVLGLFFYAVLVPMAVLLRLFGRDPMHRAMDSEETSYWIPVTRHATAETFPDLF